MFEKLIAQLLLIAQRSDGMAVNTYQQYGRYLLEASYGFDDSGNLPKTLANATHAQLSVCLLAALLAEAQKIGKSLAILCDTCAKPSSGTKEDEPSKAQRRVPTDSSGDVEDDPLIKDMLKKVYYSQFSARARTIMWKLENRENIKRKSQLRLVTEEMLMDINGCGVKTTTQILAWIRSLEL